MDAKLKKLSQYEKQIKSLGNKLPKNWVAKINAISKKLNEMLTSDSSTDEHRIIIDILANHYWLFECKAYNPERAATFGF